MTYVLLAVGAIILRCFGYRMIAGFVRLVCRMYFRNIVVEGINNLPREGPVIVCPNHPNMLVDPLLVASQCERLGRNPYIWAKGSLFKNPILGKVLQVLGAVPVFRPKRDDTGLADKDSDKSPEEIALATKIMFEHTWKVLDQGNLMVLFPEGTSYTQAHMLELRTGVMRVATGFVKAYGKEIPIVPCGLTYFRKDKFRSDVMIEFGKPLVIDDSHISSQEYQRDERTEIKRLTKLLEDRMYNVTLNAPDFEALQLAHAARRLYLSDLGELKAKDQVEFTRELVRMLYDFRSNNGKEKHESIKKLLVELKDYHEKLVELRLTDYVLHQPSAKETSILIIALQRIMFLLVLMPLAIPGLLLNMPFYYFARKLNKFAGYTESKSMFKMGMAALLIPVQWIFLILITTLLFGTFYAQIVMLALPFILYSHIRILEESRGIMDDVLSLLRLATRKSRIDELRKERQILLSNVKNAVDACVDTRIVEQIKRNIHSPEKKSIYRLRQASCTNAAI